MAIPQQTKRQSRNVGVVAAAVLMAAFLSGAMISLSAITVPVLLDTDFSPLPIITQWSRVYHYGHIELPALCVGTTGLYGYIALSKRAAGNDQWHRYAIAAATTISMVPLTWIFMVPTNDILFGMEADFANGVVEESVEMGYLRGLVVKWAWLHVGRSLTPLAGSLLGFRALLTELGA